jgi:hypothetical protein
MTWDVYAVRATPGARRLEDLADVGGSADIGRLENVVAEIRAGAPHVDATDPTWLVLEGQDHSMDIGLGKGVHVRDVTFYIRGGEGAVPLVLDLCSRLKVRAFDTETGEMLTSSSAAPVFDPGADDEADPPKRRWWRRG